MFFSLVFFFFNDTATTEIYTRKGHSFPTRRSSDLTTVSCERPDGRSRPAPSGLRSEEHTSELQSPFLISYAVFCLKKKKKSLNIIESCGSCRLSVGVEKT